MTASTTHTATNTSAHADGKLDGKACTHRPALTAKEIEALALPELVARFRRGIENIDRRLFWIQPNELDTAFLPEANVGRWPIRVLLGHVADAELVYAHRIRRTVGEDHPVLAVWDENAFIDSGLYGNLASDQLAAQTSGNPKAHTGTMGAISGYVAIIHTLRQWIADWLETLTPQQWERTAMHPERGPESVRTMVALATWHLEHHARYLRVKLDRIAPLPASQETIDKAKAAVAGSGGASCGAGCGCGSNPDAPTQA
jgi:hypothetical protein